ncbi:MAG: wbbL 5 [Microbacteriaceae bacterium]|jgi:2-polyprenyl-3-methyl-5-hydroxy-6-metoxy-1,4-benzoquinol methylase|nr:wbbL 5 [Microbacteriaceae bacterium]
MTALSPYSAHFFSPEATNNSWSNMYHSIPDGSRVLDVGCSVGNFGEALEKLKGCTVVGIDINAHDIEEAKTRISEAHVFDISSPGALERFGTFDVIVFADVIEHIPDPRAALSAARALVAPGGVVVYSIPNMGHVSVRLDLLEGRFPYAELGLLDKTHLHFYDRAEVHDVLASAGFTITDENPTTSEYPRRWTEQRLGAIGLTPGEAFFDMLRVTESNIYQYVGTAVPSIGGQKFPPTIRRYVSPPDEIQEWANAVADRSAELVDENARLNRELDDLRRWARALKKNPFGAAANALRRRLRPGR